MGMEPADAQQEELNDLWVEEVRDVVIDGFVSERMASYYRANTGLTNRAEECLNEARRLEDASATACLVFAQAAVEITLRDAILRPLVYGLVHDENIAGLIANLVENKRVVDDLRHKVLKHHGWDLASKKRDGSSKSLSMEMSSVKKLRDNAVHKGEMVSDPDAHLSLMVAGFIVEELYPLLRKRIMTLGA